MSELGVPISADEITGELGDLSDEMTATVRLNLETAQAVAEAGRLLHKPSNQRGCRVDTLEGPEGVMIVSFNEGERGVTPGSVFVFSANRRQLFELNNFGRAEAYAQTWPVERMTTFASLAAKI